MIPSSFARRDTLYYSAPAMIRTTDAFLIVCTVASAPTPPAGAWLGLPAPTIPYSGVGPTSAFSTSGTGWTGSEGNWRGVGGGATLSAGERRIVPKALVNAFGELFDDELYSDIEFIIPSRRRRASGDQSRRVQIVSEGERERDGSGGPNDTSQQVGGSFLNSPTSTDAGSNATNSNAGTTTGNFPGSVSPSLSSGQTHQTAEVLVPPGSYDNVTQETRRGGYRKIFANKKILRRSEYFEAMFEGGFSETTGMVDLESLNEMGMGTVR